MDTEGNDTGYLDPLTVSYRTIEEAAGMVFGNPKFAGKQHLEVAPEDAPLGEYNTSGWWRRTAPKIAVGVVLLALMIFVDGTHLSNDGKTKCLPIYVTLGNQHSDVARESGSRCLVGFLPMYGRGFTDSERKGVDFKARARQVHQDALRVVLAALLVAGATRDGTIPLRDANGVWRNCALRVATFMADLPEVARTLCIKDGTQCTFPCFLCFCPAHLLGRMAQHPLRTAALTQAAVQGARHLALTSTWEASNAYLKEHSVLLVDSALWGLLDFDCHTGTPLDMLHTMESGIFGWMLDCLNLHIVSLYSLLVAGKIKNRIAAKFRGLSRFGRHKVFKNGIFNQANWTAGMYRSCMMDMPIVLLDMLGDDNKATKAFTAFMVVYGMLRVREFAAGWEPKLKTALTALHSSLLFFARYLDNGLRFRKIHLALNHWCQVIWEHGAPYHTSAEANEEMHKTGAKEGWRASNKNNAQGQMMKWVLTRDAMSILAQDDDVLRMHSSQKIPDRISGKAGPSGTLRSPLGVLDLDKMMLVDYKYRQPQYAHFKNIVHAISVHLGGHPGRRHDAMPGRLPTPDSSKINLFQVMTFDRPRRCDERILLRANLSFRGQHRLHSVIVKGESGDEVFYAKLFCFFTVIFGGLKKKCAFVKWYEKVGRTNGPTGCPVLRWQMIKGTTNTGPKVPFFDVINISDILDIACVRRHGEGVQASGADQLFLANIHAL